MELSKVLHQTTREAKKVTIWDTREGKAIHSFSVPHRLMIQ